MEDPQNRNRENDGNSGKNSVYYVTNYTFELNGYADAKKVFVAGSFNNWEPIKMQYDAKLTQWTLPIFLREGTYAYKFRVDQDWMLDPANEVVRPDGMGNENNFTSVGDTIFFQLPRHYDAQKVTVAGDFNGWNFDELNLYRSLEGWILPYVLPAGNFEYKFRVDNTYLLDPNNPVRNGENDYLNNVLSIEPNQTFVLRGYSEANVVLLSGSFNNWSTSGYTMQKVDGEWRITIFLPQGKTLYKFLVDGQWIIDPNNKLWEQNEFNSKNSIIWVEP
jgi:1,4-alpha-glucan branching enzyme